LPVERATRAPIIEMKKLFLTIFASMIGISSVVFAATSVSPLDLKLKPDFEKQLECNWSMKKSLRVWVGAIEDIRQEKEVGVLVLKEESVPLTSTRPVAEILKEAIERGLKKCGYTLAVNKNQSDVVVKGLLEDFSGTSKKGLIKGQATGRAEFTLQMNLVDMTDNLSVSFAVEETQAKAISKKPKKLERILNNLLTRLTQEIFQSKHVAEWISTK